MRRVQSSAATVWPGATTTTTTTSSSSSHLRSAGSLGFVAQDLPSCASPSHSRRRRRSSVMVLNFINPSQDDSQLQEQQQQEPAGSSCALHRTASCATGWSCCPPASPSSLSKINDRSSSTSCGSFDGRDALAAAAAAGQQHAYRPVGPQRGSQLDEEQPQQPADVDVDDTVSCFTAGAGAPAPSAVRTFSFPSALASPCASPSSPWAAHAAASPAAAALPSAEWLAAALAVQQQQTPSSIAPPAALPSSPRGNKRAHLVCTPAPAPQQQAAGLGKAEVEHGTAYKAGRMRRVRRVVRDLFRLAEA